MSDFNITFLNWFYDLREPKYQVCTPESIEFWAKKISDQAQAGAATGIDCGKMCKDCAFRVNQPHNVDYLEAVDGAVLMLMQEGKFHCHTPETREDAGHDCAGFLYAKSYLNKEV